MQFLLLCVVAAGFAIHAMRGCSHYMDAQAIGWIMVRPDLSAESCWQCVWLLWCSEGDAMFLGEIGTDRVVTKPLSAGGEFSPGWQA